MVCSRCILVVRSALEKLGLTPMHVALGEVELSEENIDAVKPELTSTLNALGFELIDDRKSRTIEKIKTRIIDLVHHKNNELSSNLSDYLSQELNHDYSALSTLFSEVENTTIEKFYINQKIEKVKELITYDDLTLSEIADLLNYSSTAHLSNQFKKVTGFSPSYFKQLKENKRKKIEDL
jgi:AraC-like DNA-binding protein